MEYNAVRSVLGTLRKCEKPHNRPGVKGDYGAGERSEDLGKGKKG